MDCDASWPTLARVICVRLDMFMNFGVLVLRVKAEVRADRPAVASTQVPRVLMYPGHGSNVKPDVSERHSNFKIHP